jgi:hypothetical protein
MPQQLERPLVPLEEGMRRHVEHYRQEDPRLAERAIAGKVG